MKSRWISIDKNLPETLCEVLCCNVNDREAPIVIAMRTDDKEFYIIESRDKTTSITHWMPFPELPNLKN